jgi:hypothetical protein
LDRLGKVASVLLLLCVGQAFAADINDISWDYANAQMLRSFDRAAIAQFISGTAYSPVPVTSKDIGEFQWRDLAGDGNYELLATLDVNGRGFFNQLVIFSKAPSGKIVDQVIPSETIRGLEKIIVDIDGNGKDELIIPTHLISYSTADTYSWPAVYRLKNGEYVEDSRDFAAYYDGKVLPGLNKQISDLEAKDTTKSSSQEKIAELEMERDKILRVIGREPTAGLQQAYQWMNSSDPKLLHDAAATFQDIGGHKSEATEAWKRALAQDQAALQGS